VTEVISGYNLAMVETNFLEPRKFSSLREDSGTDGTKPASFPPDGSFLFVASSLVRLTTEVIAPCDLPPVSLKTPFTPSALRPEFQAFFFVFLKQ